MANKSKENSKTNPIPRQQLVEKKDNNALKLITNKDILESLHRLGSSMRFSFNFLDMEHECFSCGGSDVGWFKSLMATVREISQLTYYEFSAQWNHYELHPNDLTKQGYDFNLPKHINDQLGDCHQFSLSKSKGRVHGFFIENTFFIVWLDPEHNLNHDPRFGPLKLKKHPPIKTPYDIAEENLRLKSIELEEMKKDYESLFQLVDEQTSAI